MRLLIIGGGKFIGKAVAARAAARGHDVILFNRGITKPQDVSDVAARAPYRHLRGDVDQLLQHRDELRQLRADVVLHAIAYTETHGRDLVSVFAGSGARLVVLGSMDCYEAFYQLNQGRDVAELPLTEAAPTCKLRHYWQGRPGVKVYPDYDKNLLTDEVLKGHAAGAAQACVLRLPMVFGPEDPQFRIRHGDIIRRIYDGAERLIMGAVEQASVFPFGYIDNVAAAILTACDQPSGHGLWGQVFNVGERQCRSLRRWAELYSEAAAHPLEIVTVPDGVKAWSLSEAEAAPRLLVVSTDAFYQATGFTEPTQVARTLAWGLAHPEALPPKPDYQLEEQRLTAYRAALARLLA